MTPEDFNKFYIKYYPYVLRYIQRKIRHPDIANELCQDVFLMAFQESSKPYQFNLPRFVYKRAKCMVKNYYNRLWSYQTFDENEISNNPIDENEILCVENKLDCENHPDKDYYRISHYISQGYNLRESCKLAGFSYNSWRYDEMAKLYQQDIK